MGCGPDDRGENRTQPKLGGWEAAGPVFRRGIPHPSFLGRHCDQNMSEGARRQRRARKFELLSTESESNARLGRLTISYRVIETPTFMPVNTQRSVKAVRPHELHKLRAQDHRYARFLAATYRHRETSPSSFSAALLLLKQALRTVNPSPRLAGLLISVQVPSFSGLPAWPRQKSS